MMAMTVSEWTFCWKSSLGYRLPPVILQISHLQAWFPAVMCLETPEDLIKDNAAVVVMQDVALQWHIKCDSQ